MSQVTETVCDICGARRGKTNHWWKVLNEGSFISFWPLDKFDEAVLGTDHYKDVCSIGCANKALGAYVQGFESKPVSSDVEPKEDVRGYPREMTGEEIFNG